MSRFSTLPIDAREPDWALEAIQNGAEATVPVRVYGAPSAPAGAVVVHFHGGNLRDGTLDDGLVVARLLQGAGAVVMSVAYPPACAQPFPAALDAGRAVLMWAHGRLSALAGKGARLFVAGEEGGANLAAALAMQTRDQRCSALAGQILVSPMLDPRVGTASMRAASAGKTCCQWAQGWHAYLDCGSAADHPYALPARSLRLAGLPPTLVITGEDDLMRDEALAYAQRLTEAGTPCLTEVVAGETGWPLSLRCADALAAPWAAQVQARMHGFLNPNTERVACRAASAPTLKDSNPDGERS
ncbi:alpha/beta hydrolase fold domain-containing protein [Nitrogeniibacter aestuarii]|uniref:alpha/beta hydrolase fold domain-containing protein n=1 Tax=Nitrogeniibacter aestuarii TaxID=2815343 RepID=UPI001E3A7BED|nr:alpha/beta hydrolase fold domain-containing protein [Nitrogeniibacter aestuarii]